MNWIEELKQREWRLRPRTALPDNTEPYFLHVGHAPILLTAAHSTFHQRKGRRKFGEAFTAGFAQLVAEQSGAFAFYPCFEQVDDPNFSAESPFKTQLQQIIADHNIRFVLDIHGMTNRNRIGLALGTINGQSCRTIEPAIVSHFAKSGWHAYSPTEVNAFTQLKQCGFVVNLPRFAGGTKQHTVTRFASQTVGIEAAQLEICSNLRVPFERWGNNTFEGDCAAIERTLKMLVKLIGEISTTLL